MEFDDKSTVFDDIKRRLAYFAAAPVDGIGDRLIGRELQITGSDFVELCEEIERLYSINLRPFFEGEGSQQRDWLGRFRNAARDVTVTELAQYVWQSNKAK